MEALYGFAQAIHPDVSTELKRAETLAHNGFYTEAVLRLGRTVECSLYRAAANLNRSLEDLVIKELDDLSNAIRERQVSIIRNREFKEIKKAAEISKRLSEAIAELANNESLWEGVPGDQPRGNHALFKDLLSQVQDPHLKRHFKQIENLLTTIQTKRNRAAHASLEGKFTEFTKEDYLMLLQETEKWLSYLAEIIAFENARIAFSKGTAE